MIDIDVSKIVSEIGEPTARLIENEDEKRRRMIVMICSAVFLFLFIIGTILFSVLNKNSKVLADDLSFEVNNLEENNKNLLDYEKQAQEIEQRNQSINTILGASANWSYVFEKLEEVVPKGIVFTRFEVASKDDMRILGVSPDYEELTKLEVAMKDSGYFGNVLLTNASLASNGEEQMVNFVITFGFAKKIDRDSVVKEPQSNIKEENSSSDSSQDKLPSDSAKDTNDNSSGKLPTSSDSNNGSSSIPIL